MRISFLIVVVFSINACKLQERLWDPYGALKGTEYVVANLYLHSDSTITASQIETRNIVAINNHCNGDIHINGVYTIPDSIEYRLKEIINNPSKSKYHPKSYEEAYVLFDHSYKSDTCMDVNGEHIITVNKSLRTIHGERADYLDTPYPDTIYSIDELKQLNPKIFLKIGIRMWDAGIVEKLPPWTGETPDISKLKPRNVLEIKVNAKNKISVRDEEIEIGDLRGLVERFIMNPDNELNLAEDPTKAVLSIKNDRGTKYEIYVEVYNEIIAAYNNLWNEEAHRQFGLPYNESLDKEKRRSVRNAIPKTLIEAEPTEFEE